MYCTYRSCDGCSIWNKKQTSCNFMHTVAVILCIMTVAKQMLHLKCFWYSDAWLEYPNFDTEEDIFYKYMLLLFKQAKEQNHIRNATNTDVC